MKFIKGEIYNDGLREVRCTGKSKRKGKFSGVTINSTEWYKKGIKSDDFMKRSFKEGGFSKWHKFIYSNE